ncbi:MAG: PQQ-dependent sugar dehydrogenase [Fermentimonas sp.]|nr:PQQ-dependent sugar dehydrogenase [Fermentimonas sp.]
MYHLKITALIAVLFLFSSASCDERKTNNEEELPAEMLPPVETQDPNTSYQPAFDGQTRIAGVKTETPYSVTTLTSELDSPWAVVELPDGRFAITEKGGTMRIVTKEGEVSEAITGFPEVDDRNQGGLLDVAPAPDFETSRMLFFSFAERTSQGSLTAVGKGRLSDDESVIENFTTIYRAIPYFDNSMHFGSRLVFNEAGNIFVTTGERSSIETRYNAQKLETAHGKVLHITPDGKPVDGNPLINTPGALPEIYSYGHRNPQGLDIHPTTGDIWISEMGPRGGDEINLIEPGKDYGWPTITYGIEYNGNTIGDGITQHEDMEQPVYYWDPVLSPGGMTFYSSNVIPEWENNLFIGGLSSKHIARLVFRDNKVVGEERLLVDQNERIRDVEEGSDGALYAVTDSGKLFRIAKSN